MYYITNLTHDFINEALKLGESLHAESYYRDSAFSPEVCASFLRFIINNPHDACCFIAVNEGKMIGGVVGVKNYHYFNSDSFAVEDGLFIQQDFRGVFNTLAAELIGRLEEWARDNGMKYVSVGYSFGDREKVMRRFYKKLGYQNLGNSLIKQV